MSAPGGLLRFLLCALLGGALFYADAERGAFAEARGRWAAVLIPFRAVAEFPRDALAAAAAHMRAREDLLAERDGLRDEIRRMRTRVNSLDFFAAQNDALRRLLRLRRNQDGELIAAEVAADGRGALLGRLTLDRGQRDGVLPGMGVVDEFGVVGQVTRVEAEASVVNLIVDGDQWLAGRVKRTGALAVLRGVGDGGGELAVEFMPKDADLRIGDELVADDVGAYPPGYPVGRVVAVDRPEGDIHLAARALPQARLTENRALLIYAAATADGGE